jgi:hypothetical protein
MPFFLCVYHPRLDVVSRCGGKSCRSISRVKGQAREQRTFRERDATDADRKAIEGHPVTNTLWRQIDRGVSEGGAIGDGTGSSAPEGDLKPPLTKEQLRGCRLREFW